MIRKMKRKMLLVPLSASDMAIKNPTLNQSIKHETFLFKPRPHTWPFCFKKQQKTTNQQEAVFHARTLRFWGRPEQKLTPKEEFTQTTVKKPRDIGTEGSLDTTCHHGYATMVSLCSDCPRHSPRKKVRLRKMEQIHLIQIEFQHQTQF